MPEVITCTELPKTINVQLSRAVHFGHLDELERQIDQISSSTITFQLLTILLNDAVKQNHIDIVRLLLERGAKVDTIDHKTYNSPLHFAIANRNKRIVHLLLKANASVNIINRNGEVPLHIAAAKGDLDIFTMILNKVTHDHYNGYFNINAKDNGGDTPLSFALKDGNMEQARLLLNNGAGVKDYSALRIAIENGYQDIVDELFKFARKIDINRTLSLFTAVLSGNKDIVYMLIEKYHADVNMKNMNGQTPLHLAVDRNKLEFVQLLLQQGACVDAKDNSGNTPLYYAVTTKESKNVIEILIEHGANINTENYLSDSVLHIAIRSGSKEVCQFLLEKGANPNARNSFGETVIYKAVINRQIHLVDVLLKYGADLHNVNKEEKTILHTALWDNNIELCRFFLDKGIDVNMKNNYGKPLIYEALLYGYDDIVKLFIEYGAYIHFKNEDGETMLYTALRSRDYKCFKLLLEKGIDPSTKNKNGDTILNIAIKISARNFIKLLLNYELDFNCLSTTYFELETNFIKDHLVKLKYAGVYLNDNCLKLIENFRLTYQLQCKNEISNMMLLRVGNISYYDILTQIVVTVSNYLKNKNFATNLESKNYIYKFPIYADLLQAKLERAVFRKQLTSLANDAIATLFKLPHLVTEKIVNCLSTSDIHAIIAVSKYDKISYL